MSFQPLTYSIIGSSKVFIPQTIFKGDINKWVYSVFIEEYQTAKREYYIDWYLASDVNIKSNKMCRVSYIVKKKKYVSEFLKFCFS